MNPRNRNILIGVVIGLVVVCCCCLAVTAGIVIADPFGWHLLSLFTGGDPIAQAVPADIPVYASTDLKALTSPQLARLLKAFADVPGGSKYSSSEAAIQELDQNLEKQLGLTFSGDIEPWLGGNAGLAVTELPQSGSASQGAYVLLVNARDTGKADAFIRKFVDGLVKNNNSTSSETDFQGVTLHVLTPSYGEPTVIARSKNLVLVATSPAAVQTAIEAQTGKVPTLAASADFKQMRAKLPSGTLLSLYFNGTSLATFAKNYQNSMSSLGTTLAPAQTGLEAVRSLGLALSAVDQGLRLDATVAIDEQKLTDPQRQLYTTQLDETASRLLPENTLAYLAGQGLDQAWANYRSSANPNDVKDMLSSFESQYGFNPEEALFPYLKGNWLLALVPDSNSYLAQASGAGNYGFVGLVDTNNASALGQTLQTFNSKLESNGSTIDTQTLAGVQAYALSAGGKPIVVYGIGQNHFALASSAGVFTDVFDKNKSLADVEAYQQVWQAFPSGAQRVFYADVAGIMKLARTGMSGSAGQSFDQNVAPYLQPIQTVALSTLPLKNGVAQTTLIVFIGSTKP